MLFIQWKSNKIFTIQEWRKVFQCQDTRASSCCTEATSVKIWKNKLRECIIKFICKHGLSFMVLFKGILYFRLFIIISYNLHRIDVWNQLSIQLELHRSAFSLLSQLLISDSSSDSSSMSSRISSLMLSSRLPWLRHVLTVDPLLMWAGLGYTTRGLRFFCLLRGCTHSVPGTWGSGWDRHAKWPVWFIQP